MLNMLLIKKLKNCQGIATDKRFITFPLHTMLSLNYSKHLSIITETLILLLSDNIYVFNQ